MLQFLGTLVVAKTLINALSAKIFGLFFQSCKPLLKEIGISGKRDIATLFRDVQESPEIRDCWQVWNWNRPLNELYNHMCIKNVITHVLLETTFGNVSVIAPLTFVFVKELLILLCSMPPCCIFYDK